MAVPVWFNGDDYFQNKLAASGGMSEAELKAAFRASGYDTTTDGMYQHYLDYAQAEWTSPNKLFNSQDYIINKARIEYDTTTPTLTQISEIEAALARDGFTPWTHYREYGWRENFDAAETFGINPSGKFDQEKYFRAKLQQMRDTDPAGEWNISKIKEAFMASGLDPLTHWLEWGVKENLNYTPDDYSPTEPGKTFLLTKGDDVFTGGAGDDYFEGDPGTLGDYDKLDGDGGYDSLWAIINGANNVTRPAIKNIEKISFSAQHEREKDTGDNNVTNTVNYERDELGKYPPSQGHEDDWPVAIDADRIEGMTYLENDRSRADLAVEDVTTWSPMLTVAFKDTDPGDVDWGVFFDPQAIKAMDSNADLDIQLMDVVYAELEELPLKYLNITGINFVHRMVDGTTNKFTLKMRAEDKALYTGDEATYETLLQAFENALADFEEANPDYKGVFEVELGPDFTGIGELDGKSYTSDGTSIRLHSNKGAVSAPTLNTGAVDDAPSSLRLHTDIKQMEGCPLYQTNIHLDNVGRVSWGDARPDCLPSHDDYGSVAGDMVVGSMATYGGIERFDVTVDRGSWLDSLSSTNNALRMVTVKNVGEGNQYMQAEEDAPGQLYLGASREPDATNLVHWQDKNDLLHTNGLTDVKLFDGSTFEGKMNIGARITYESYSKYTKDVDGLRTFYDQFAPDGNFKYNLGVNHDKLNMTVNSSIAADVDFDLEVNAGTGNDFINFNFTTKKDMHYSDGKDELSWDRYEEMQDAITDQQIRNADNLRNIVLRGEAGNDTIKAWGRTALTAEGGEGMDNIHVSQNLTLDDNTVFVLNSDSSLDREIGIDSVHGAQPLNNNVQSTRNYVDYTGAGVGQKIYLTVTYRGVESHKVLVTLQAGDKLTGSGTLSTVDVNKAIIAAINNDPTLQHVLVAKDGAGKSLLIESLHDGYNALDDFSVNFWDALNGVVSLTGAGATAYDTEYAVTKAAGTGVVLPTEIQGLEFGEEATPAVVALDPASLAGLQAGDKVYFEYNGTIYEGEMPDPAGFGSYEEALADAFASATDGADDLEDFFTPFDADGNVVLDENGSIVFTATTDGELGDLDTIEISADTYSDLGATASGTTAAGGVSELDVATKLNTADAANATVKVTMTYKGVDYEYENTLTAGGAVPTDAEIVAFLQAAVTANAALATDWPVASITEFNMVEDGQIRFTPAGGAKPEIDFKIELVDTIVDADVDYEAEDGTDTEPVSFDFKMDLSSVAPGETVTLELNGAFFNVVLPADLTDDDAIAAAFDAAMGMSGWEVDNVDLADDWIITFSNDTSTWLFDETPKAALYRDFVGNGPFPGAVEQRGDDRGTESLNRVDGGAGDDVIVLNAGSDRDWYDVLEYKDDVLTGHDTVFNFDTGFDKIDLSFYGKEGGAFTAGGMPTDGWTAKSIAAAVTGSFSANGKGAGLIWNEDNTYTVFKVVNDSNVAVVENEVTILGTVTFDDTTAMISDGDIVLA